MKKTSQHQQMNITSHISLAELSEQIALSWDAKTITEFVMSLASVEVVHDEILKNLCYRMYKDYKNSDDEQDRTLADKCFELYNLLD